MPSSGWLLVPTSWARSRMSPLSPTATQPRAQRARRWRRRAGRWRRRRGPARGSDRRGVAPATVRLTGECPVGRPTNAATSSDTAANSPRPCSHSKRTGHPASGHGRSRCTTRHHDRADDHEDAERQQPDEARPAEVDDEHASGHGGHQRPSGPDEERGGHDPHDAGDPASAHRDGLLRRGQSGRGELRRRRAAAVEQRRARCTRARRWRRAPGRWSAAAAPSSSS